MARPRWPKAEVPKKHRGKKNMKTLKREQTSGLGRRERQEHKSQKLTISSPNLPFCTRVTRPSEQKEEYQPAYSLTKNQSRCQSNPISNPILKILLYFSKS